MVPSLSTADGKLSVPDPFRQPLCKDRDGFFPVACDQLLEGDEQCRLGHAVFGQAVETGFGEGVEQKRER